MRKLILGLTAAALLFALTTPAHALACEGVHLSGGGCLFTITGGDTADPDDGFAVTNQDGVPMWDFVSSRDLQAVGYPISQRWTDGPFTLQAFQKVILQWAPHDSRMNWLNTLDVLANRYSGVRLPNVPSHRTLPEDSGADFAQITRNHLALLDANPKIREAFLAEPDWLNLYGLPINYEEIEVGGNPQGLQLLRAQRIVFEVWNVPAPGTSLGAVGRQNVPDKIKQLDNVLIPNGAKAPMTVAQTGLTVVSPPATTARAGPAPTPRAAPAPTPAPTPTPDPTPAPRAVDQIPTPRALPQGLTGYGVQGELRGDFGAAAASRATEAGLNWVKQQVPWAEVENRPGVFYWNDLDRLVETMRGHNLNIMFSVVKAPDFYKAEQAKVGTGHGRPADPAKLRDFMRVLADRYRGRVHAYEIWNEENLEIEWGRFSGASYGQFVDLLKNGYLGVKESDPNAIVILGAPTPTGVLDNGIAIDDAFYLRQVFDYNGGEVFQYFEALGVHPNGGPNAPDDTLGNAQHTTAVCGGGWSTHPSFFFDRYKELHAMMAERGHAEKTVWFTEFGWASVHGAGAPAGPARGFEYASCITEANQADFLTRAFAKVRAETPYVTHMIIWNLNLQQVVPNTDEKWAFGILRADGSPRPAYEAIKNMPKPGRA